jgi:heat shock protein HslJ
VQVSGAEYVPVIVSSPPPPSATATPTRPAPTATIAPTPAAEIAFWADRYQVNQGECARLSWRALNVAAVWVYPQGQPYSNNRKPPEGSQVVCPPVTTTYEMRVEQYDGRVIFQQVTIQVRPIPTPTKVAPTTTSVPPTATRIPPTATPVPPTATKVPPTATPVPPTATPVPPTATSVPSSPLANTSWVVTRFEGFGVPIGNPPTIGFTADNRAEIFGGCNSFQATYSTNGNQIAILVGVGTTMLCGENVDQQETYYIQLLSRAAFYEMPGAELILRDAGGMELLRFARR